MSSTTFFCHPRELADALDNAVIIGNGTGNTLKDNTDSCPWVYLAYQDSGDGENGVVAVYGAGRRSMGRTIIKLEGQSPLVVAYGAISVKSAKTLQSMLRTAPCGADATAAVTIYDETTQIVVDDFDDDDIQIAWVDVSVAKNGESIADLAGPEDGEGWEWIMDAVDDVLLTITEDVEGPMALTLDGVKRLASIHTGSKIVDFARTAKPGVLAWRAGTDATGIIGEIDRAAFVARRGGEVEELISPPV